MIFKANGILCTPDKITLSLMSRPSDSVNALASAVQDGKLLDCKIEIYREKRSKAANSMVWAIIGQIADVLRTDKDSVYYEMLTRYGQREEKMFSIRQDAYETFCRAADNHCCVVEVNGNIFTVAILIGSSKYNTRQMAILIDGVMSDAKELGIDTMTESEKDLILRDWESSQK
jgi:hypothetical protein